MSFHDEVHRFFTKHAVGSIQATAQPKLQIPEQNLIGFTLTHEAYGTHYHVPPLSLTKHNAWLTIKDWSHAADVMNNGPYEMSITHLGDIGAREGTYIIPIEWYVPCEVNAPSVLEDMEAIDNIARGTRIEHFFVHDKEILARWDALLLRLSSEYATACVQHGLRNFVS